MSPFEEEWRDCLREQYKSVIREDDQITLKTLTGVMLEVGFRETELQELRIVATMKS